MLNSTDGDVKGVKILEKAGVVDSGAKGFVYVVADRVYTACLNSWPHKICLKAHCPSLFPSFPSFFDSSGKLVLVLSISKLIH